MSQMMQDGARVTVEHVQDVIYDLSNGVINDPNWFSRWRYFSKAEYLKNVAFYRQSNYGTL